MNDQTAIADKRTAEIDADVERLRSQGVASRTEVRAALTASGVTFDTAAEVNLKNLERVRDRQLYLAEIKSHVEELQREANSEEMNAAAAVRGDIMARAQRDADLLLSSVRPGKRGQ